MPVPSTREIMLTLRTIKDRCITESTVEPADRFWFDFTGIGQRTTEAKEYHLRAYNLWMAHFDDWYEQFKRSIQKVDW